jgi:predicted nuclease of predicted toxin-antitoxin system
VPELRFLADMNISPSTVSEHQDKGWDISRVSDVLSGSARNQDILSFARDRTLILITQDLDFSALLAVSGHTRPSVITLRLEEPRPHLVTLRLVEVIAALGSQLEEGVVASVDESSVRYRTLPIGSEPS